MNAALIFAGGVGVRMGNGATPKQFLSIYGKPIIIYTLEVFENCADIDVICISCVASHLDYMRSLCEKYQIKKVKWIVPGGKTGQLSICHGIQKLHENCPPDTVVLIHDGVRPIIDEALLLVNIACVRAHGSAISCANATETHVRVDESGAICEVVARKESAIAKAPQSFFLGDVWAGHEKALTEGRTDFIDSASLMINYGMKMHTVPCSNKNIKITEPADYFIVKSIIDAQQNSQVFGV